MKPNKFSFGTISTKMDAALLVLILVLLQCAICNAKYISEGMFVSFYHYCFENVNESMLLS